MRVQHQVPRPRRASDKPSVRQRAVTPATVLFSFAAIIATDVPAARRALNLLVRRPRSSEILAVPNLRLSRIHGPLISLWGFSQLTIHQTLSVGRLDHEARKRSGSDRFPRL
jgi:hypothetical protein